MRSDERERGHWLSGFQWFFFIFCNTVVVPPTLQSAFNLSPEKTFCITQYTFIVTAIACLSQALWGHRRAIMEGPTGLWWITILTLTLGESANGTSLVEIGGNLAVGIMISGVVTIIIGISGLGHRLASWFRPGVMAVFMFLLGAQLINVFMKGMLGMPFGIYSGPVTINPATFSLALGVMMLMVVMIVLLPPKLGKYTLLIGTMVGWALYLLFFTPTVFIPDGQGWLLFPLGEPGNLHPGIIITTVLTGVVNISNNFGAIRGTDQFYPNEQSETAMYRRSFIVSGLMTMGAAPLGIVPFSPFVSSIGLLTQTQDSRLRSFIIGCLLFLTMGSFAWLTRIFCSIPLTISSAVMLVSYLPLLYSAVLFIKQMSLNARNIYRLAIPLFFGVFFMSIPTSFLQAMPVLIRPLVSNGLLMGILIALLVENLIPWDRIK
ncbi:uracil/xanthine transporter [Yersinia intermedia]|uniref:uracil/xanthine transporter n=1 Tax=Yersinia intermedia TaxID=631 RepID=UPI0011A7CB7D|nr:uracil/xanthine transporter [Yersinia intermedia]